MPAEYDAKFLAKLLEIFKGEAREHISEMSAKLEEIEHAKDADLISAVETIFRRAHSLKAAAQAVGRQEISTVCQAMESVFAALKRGEITATRSLLDTMLRANDALGDFLAAVEAPLASKDQLRAFELAGSLNNELETAGSPPSPRPETPSPASEVDAAAESSGTDEVEDDDESVAINPPSHTVASEPAPAPGRELASDGAMALAPISSEAPAATQAAAIPSALPSAPRATGMVRLPVKRLETLLLEAEGMILSKLAAHDHARTLADSVSAFSEWDAEWQKTQSALHVLQQDARLAEDEHDAADPKRTALNTVLRFLEWNEGSQRTMAANLALNTRSAKTEAHSFGSKVDRLLHGVKQALMQQCMTMLNEFSRTVRDLGRDQGKTVNLVLEGAALEMDRRILEALREPLLHLVRNSIDHGIEKPEERIAAGKTATATVKITASQKDSSKVEFTITDDGAGIDIAKVAAAAVKQRILSPDRAPLLSEPESLALIFQSGLSTSPLITDISGRGLGMAIVREVIENLGGTITVESRRGQGTTFRLIVPLTLATFRGVCVRVADRLFVVPTLALSRVVSAERNTIETVENRAALIIDGMPVMLVKLRDVLELSDPQTRLPGDKLFAMVLGAAERRVAFEVDEILGDQEILIKPLGRYLARVPNVLGAAVLGTGRVAPVLNSHDLLKSAATAARIYKSENHGQNDEAIERDKSILVVEDSITARGLLKNILETAGYRVTTAVDGADAWSTLRLETFQLVISDVEMPRMNGFDLTARIRADKKLTELPVLLLTALESREDRERGVDVGANAYIVKSDFDQERLLDVIRRLI
jgi:two-component system chemotaxis sensor kinase CheA